MHNCFCWNTAGMTDHLVDLVVDGGAWGSVVVKALCY